MEDIEEILKDQRIKQAITKRKTQIEEKLWKKRLENSSNHIQLLEIEVEEEKEEHLREPKKGFLPLYQHYKGHYHRRKKKMKRCWICKSRGHFKRDCPRMKCFYCGRQGHKKRRNVFNLNYTKRSRS